jgi:transcriptional regulator with XRE-family HTH domain
MKTTQSRSGRARRSATKKLAPMTLVEFQATGMLSNFTLGGVIEEARRKFGLSLRGLAKRIGISFPYLSRIERNMEFPSTPVLKKLAGELGLDAAFMKRLDTRVPFDDLRRMVRRSEALQRALHDAIRHVNEGALSLDEFAELLSADNVRQKISHRTISSASKAK